LNRYALTAGFALIAGYLATDLQAQASLNNTIWELSHRYLVAAQSTQPVVAADEQLYLHFQEEGVAEVYDGGNFQAKGWLLANGKVWLSIRGQLNFRLRQLDDQSLILEFEIQEPVRSIVQYHFRRVEYDATPFSPNYQNPTNTATPDPPPPANDLEQPPLNAEIRIELAGGGFEESGAGILYDVLLLRNDGKLLREKKRVDGTTARVVEQLERKAVEQLAVALFEEGFFYLQDHYQCTTAACSERLKQAPRPIPLRLIVEFGYLRKAITVDLYDWNHPGASALPIPDGLVGMIDRIRTLAPLAN